MDRETLQFCCDFYKSRRLSSNRERPGFPQPSVDYIENLEFGYSEFFRKYLLPNTPCVLASSFTEGWNSRRRWVTEDGKPNFQQLLHRFGDAVIPVANCDVKEYNANPKECIPLKEYIDYWQDHIQNGYSSPRGCLYLKDWHMHRAFPEHDVYFTPLFFTSDWLNEYWDTIQVDDYRFVYMGPKGSWTPFHADVFRSYSWSANICGRKKWLLFPPGQEERLRDCHGNLAYDVTAPALQDQDLYPEYNDGCRPIEIVQEAGEVIFVPSGWHHQVYNLLMMKSCSGIDYAEFYAFLKVIAKNRMRFLDETPGDGDASLSRGGPLGALSVLGPSHAVFDLHRTAEVLRSLISNPDFQRLDRDSLAPQPLQLLHDITEVIESTFSPL
ncbi:2-oxoglutarate and iron-dependent oxygenase JMJD4 isoform X2 [Latimeria chalumnae]|uniref:2-oxoglutarate and iron-dependent oxygenase JMJD4 isoform X2 n=1 Tax=Latimeria chalumnae TaxID=7897 RepID=UPI00313C3164